MKKSTAQKTNADWLELVELYLLLRDIEYLQKASAEAQKIGEIEISRFLKIATTEYARVSSRLKDLDEFCRQSEKLFTKLEDQNQKKESLILKLLNLDLHGRLVARFDYYPVKKQMEILEWGIQACMEGLNITRRLKLEACEAVYLMTIANGFDSANKPLEAVTYYKLAIRKYKKLAVESHPENEVNLAGVLRNLGTTYCNLGKTTLALKMLKKSQKMFEKWDQKLEGTLTEEIAATLHDLGSTFDEAKYFEKSIKFYKKSIGKYEELIDSGSKEYEIEIAQALNNLGLVQYKTGQKEQSSESFNKAFTIIQGIIKDSRNEKSIVAIMCNLADIMRDRDDFERAALLYKQALEINKNSGSSKETEAHRAYILEGIATTFKSAHQFAQAVNYYKKALRKYKKLEKFEPDVYLNEILRIQNNLGGAYGEAGNFIEAEKILLEALNLCQNKAAQSQQVSESSEADILMTLGNVMEIAGRFENAIQYFKKSLKILRKLDENNPKVYSGDVAGVLRNLGSLQRKSGNPEVSLEKLNEALVISQKLAAVNPQMYEIEVAKTLALLGYLHAEYFKEKDGLAYFKQAREIIERVRHQVQSPDQRRLLFQQFIDVYSNITISQINLGQWKRALETVEQGKSRTLVDLLRLKKIRPKRSSGRKFTRAESHKLGNLADDYENNLIQIQILDSYLSKLYQDQIEMSKKNVNVANSASYASRKRMRVSDNEKEIVRCEKEKLRLIQDRNNLLTEIRVFDKNFPQQVELLNRKQIFEVSRKSNRVIVIFRIYSDAALIFIVFPNSDFEHLIIKDFTTAQLNQMTDKWSRTYSKFLLAGKKETQFVNIENFPITQKFPDSVNNQSMSVLSDLYKCLLKPIIKLVKKRSYKEILFVPNRALAILPLHACFWRKNKKIHYLIDLYTISYATTVSVFKKALENMRRRSFYEKFLFVTNPTEDLPYAEIEVNKIISTFTLSNEKYLDLRSKDALKTSVSKQIKDEQFGIYHFSCHGNYDWEDAFASALKLADGSLTLKEIMESNLSRSWLTTLSACNTGLVNYKEMSDEHYGFPFGFVYAGCPSVWATLWSVDDKSTSELIEKAYRFLKHGSSKPEALRLAQLEYKKEKEGTHYSSPFYWAGFQHYGV